MPANTRSTQSRPHGGPACYLGRPRPASLRVTALGRQLQQRLTHRYLTVYPVWSTTMPANTRSTQSRPHGGPACYLARPASLRVTALSRQLQQRLTHRTGKSWS